MKQLIRKIFRPPYAYLRYFLHRYFLKGYFKPYYLYDTLTLENVSADKMSYFGYYNVSPENDKGAVLYGTLPKKGSSLELYSSLKDDINIHIGSTKSHNLQQGAMLQWGYTNKNICYYNIYNSETKKYESVAYNIDTKQIIDNFTQPIYSLSKQEDYFLTLDFERLTIMRPDYGYFCNPNDDIKLLPYESDGIWKYDIKEKKSKLIISLTQLINLKYVDTMQGAMHKVNHIDISPDGKRFMFLHRWVGEKGRFMRLITAKADGTDIYILNGDIMTSHSYWMDNNKIISFCYTPKYGEAYTIFEDKTDKISKLSDKLPKTDGHPSVTTDGKWLVTDTYPTRSRFSSLYLYNIESDNLYKLGEFYQPLKYSGEKRIDLHPKLNMSGDTVYFESGHTGERRLYSINLSNLK